MLEASVALQRAAARRGQRLVTGKPLHQRHAFFLRKHATQTTLGTTQPKSRRKQVTVLNDTGRVPWKELTIAEKAARTTQQSFNASVILIGLIMTVGVATFLWTDVFSSQSKTNHFNRAVDRVKRDPRCTELLGPTNKITAYGEPSWSKWRRNRPIASKVQTDKYGVQTMYMHFNVSGPLNDGVVHVQMTKYPGENQYQYRYLALDVQGHSRIYLENADTDKNNKSASSGFKLLGKRWN